MLLPSDRPLSQARYREVFDELSAAMGEVNAGLVRLLEATEVVLDEGHHVGSGLRSAAHFLAWRTGLSGARCGELVTVVKRREQLPVLYAALKAGELTLDQAVVVARHVPADFDASVTAFAKDATVAQLVASLPAYGWDKPKPKRRFGISTGNDDDGWWIRGRATTAEGAVIDQALQNTRDALRAERKATLPEGEHPEPVSTTDALVAIAEGCLASGEAARPGSDRWKVHVHLHHDPSGGLALTTTTGRLIADPERRHLLCDPTLQALVERGTTSLAAGRTTRQVTRKLRRAILHRDRTCRVPGCTASRHLEIHHIWHWEDGGPTDPHNLIALCWHHHHQHHHGLLHIDGTATNVRIKTTSGLRLEPVGHPATPTPSPNATPYHGPLGEHLDKTALHFNPAPPPPPPPPVAEPPPLVASG